MSLELGYVNMLLFVVLRIHHLLLLLLLLHPFNGLFSRTTWVSHHREVNHSGFYWSKRDGVAVASAGQYANHLHLAPDR